MKNIIDVLIEKIKETDKMFLLFLLSDKYENLNVCTITLK